jgi:uncharacterized membrane protein
MTCLMASLMTSLIASLMTSLIASLMTSLMASLMAALIRYDVLEHNCHHWSFVAASVLGVQPPPSCVIRVMLSLIASLIDHRPRASSESCSSL